jgi:hypothetical protein
MRYIDIVSQWRMSKYAKELKFSGVTAVAHLECATKSKYGVISMHASVLVDSVGSPNAEVCRTAASFP